MLVIINNADKIIGHIEFFKTVNYLDEYELSYILYTVEEFLRFRIGPVVMKDEVEYFKEVRLQQQITVTYALAGHALDGSRFLLPHEIFRPDGELSARVTSTGGWLNLAERKLVVPPPTLLSVMNSLEKTSDFIVLPSSIKAGV